MCWNFSCKNGGGEWKIPPQNLVTTWKFGLQKSNMDPFLAEDSQAPYATVRNISAWTSWTPRFVDCIWNVMAHAQKPNFVFRWNGRVHLNRRGPQYSRLLAAEVCASAVIMLDTPCSVVVWRVLATHFIRQFPLHFPSRASPCAITFQLDSTHL